jgi:hypothetical protein
MSVNHEEVIAGIARLEAGQADIKERFGEFRNEQNELWGHVRGVQQDLLRHLGECQLIPRVRLLEQRAAAEIEARKVEERAEAEAEVVAQRAEVAREQVITEAQCRLNKLTEWVLKPLVTAVFLAIAALVATHIDAVLKFLK